MDRCVACGAELGVGRFCLNCGHPIGAPAPAQLVATEPEQVSAEQDREPDPVARAVPVQAADPTPVPPVGEPEPAPRPPSARASSSPTRTDVPPDRSGWDPDRELLPYEEVDDPLVDDPLPGRAWIGWVLGAVVLVGLVLLLLRVLGTDGEDTTATDATSETSSADPGTNEPSGTTDGGGGDASEEPAGVGKRVDLATRATFEVPSTAPATTDFDGNLVAYEASQMHDGNLSTTWRMAGDATGQTITITLPRPGVVDRVGLVNGYSKQVAGVDWYPNNRRILSVAWGFDDGSSVPQSFAERPGLQRLKVPPTTTSVVTITITSVTPPGSGNLGRDYTAISEVVVIGRRAG